jgi:hypothetical protein
MPRLICVGLVLGATALASLGGPNMASADTLPQRARIPHTDLIVALDGGGVVVTGADGTASLDLIEPWPDLHMGIDAGAEGDKVTITVDTNCSGGAYIHTTVAMLHARIALHRAAIALGKQAWADAIAAADQSLALAPTLTDAALLKARAQVGSGAPADATATLVALAAQHRALVVWQVATDPVFAPLGAAPALAGLAAATPGHVTARAFAKHPFVGGRELAVYGYATELTNSMSGEADPPGFRLVEADTGLVIADGAPAAAALERGLAALGMAGGPAIALEPVGNTGKARGLFPGTRLAVIGHNDHVRVLTGNHVFGEARLAFDLGRTQAVRVPSGVIVHTPVNIGDGCGGWNYEDVAFIPLPADPR